MRTLDDCVCMCGVYRPPNILPRRQRMEIGRTEDVQKTSRTSSESLTYVQFTFCVYRITSRHGMQFAFHRIISLLSSSSLNATNLNPSISDLGT